MSIYLGNLTVEQIERRLGIEFTEEDRKELKENYQAKVNDTPLEPGKWHCFDMPFILMTNDRESAEKYLNIFQEYDQSKFKECFQIGWEN